MLITSYLFTITYSFQINAINATAFICVFL